jgi:hypothetical protein
MSVGDQMKIRAQWTAPDPAKYTHLGLHGASNFTINEVSDETLSRAQSSDVSGQYVLMGPRSSGTTKTIVVLMTARRAGNNSIVMSVWGSGDFDSAPPSNAASARCSAAIYPR